MEISSSPDVDNLPASNISGLISDIQNFVVHDGPGLRVIVFLKGCSLTCRWCQNPECINFFPEVAFHWQNCLGCMKCSEICPIPGAIIEGEKQRIDRNKCTRCMRCVDVCPGRALQKVGELISAEKLLDKILRYRPFFDRSGKGGVTLSGGEPLFQPKFSLTFLRLCHENGVNTAVETSGFAQYKIFLKVVKSVDLILYDIKHMDDVAHKVGTGRSNKLILNNLSRFCQDTDTEVVVRIPLIPGYNDDYENIRKTAEFVASLKRIKQLDLLPFNQLASAKYAAMGIYWQYKNTKQQPKKQLAKLQNIVEACGLETNIGGLW